MFELCKMAEAMKKNLTTFMEFGRLSDCLFEVDGKNYKAQKVIIACKYFQQWFHFEFFFFSLI